MLSYIKMSCKQLFTFRNIDTVKKRALNNNIVKLYEISGIIYV